MNEYEALGRLHLEHENLKREYAKLLGVVRWITTGEVTVDRVSVTGDSWNLAPLAPKPPEDADA